MAKQEAMDSADLDVPGAACGLLGEGASAAAAEATSGGAAQGAAGDTERATRQLEPPGARTPLDERGERAADPARRPRCRPATATMTARLTREAEVRCLAAKGQRQPEVSRRRRMRVRST